MAMPTLPTIDFDTIDQIHDITIEYENITCTISAIGNAIYNVLLSSDDYDLVLPRLTAPVLDNTEFKFLLYDKQELADWAEGLDEDYESYLDLADFQCTHYMPEEGIAVMISEIVDDDLLIHLGDYVVSEVRKHAIERKTKLRGFGILV